MSKSIMELRAVVVGFLRVNVFKPVCLLVLAAIENVVCGGRD